MKKFSKLLLSLTLILTISFTFTGVNLLSVKAATQEVIVDTDKENEDELEIYPRGQYLCLTKKTNVKTSEEWGSYYRVLDNLDTRNSGGGSLSANRSVSFGVAVSGSINGLGISTSGSISSSIGYTLNVSKGKRVYMAYRVKYKVEKGTRQVVNVRTGKVEQSNSYTVKKPSYGEYTLKNAY